MTSIWDNKEFMEKHRPAYWFPIRGYGEKQDVVILWYAYTPTGKISKYQHQWALFHASGCTDEWLENRVKKYIEDRRLPKLRKGYVWSEPYIERR